MACSLLVERPLTMKPGSNWEILDGDGKDCCLTSRRSVSRDSMCERRRTDVRNRVKRSHHRLMKSWRCSVE